MEFKKNRMPVFVLVSGDLTMLQVASVRKMNFVVRSTSFA